MTNDFESIFLLKKIKLKVKFKIIFSIYFYPKIKFQRAYRLIKQINIDKNLSIPLTLFFIKRINTIKISTMCLYFNWESKKTKNYEKDLLKCIIDYFGSEFKCSNLKSWI